LSEHPSDVVKGRERRKEKKGEIGRETRERGRVREKEKKREEEEGDGYERKERDTRERRKI